MSSFKITAAIIIVALIITGCGGSRNGADQFTDENDGEAYSLIGTWRADTGGYTHFYDDGTGRTESDYGQWEFTWEAVSVADVEQWEHLYTLLDSLVDIGVLSEDDLDEFGNAINELMQRLGSGEISAYEVNDEIRNKLSDAIPVEVLFLTFPAYPNAPPSQHEYILDGADNLRIFTGHLGRILSMNPNVDMRFTWVDLTRVG